MDTQQNQHDTAGCATCGRDNDNGTHTALEAVGHLSHQYQPQPMARPLASIYLAARYSRREELCRYRTDLERAGFTVTSRWLNGNHQIDDAGLSLEAKAEERQRFAQEDWDDLLAADIVVSFTEEPRGTNSRGGRHVEFGAGLALGKRAHVVGPRENVFHCLPSVTVHVGWWNAFAALLIEEHTPAIDTEDVA